MFHRSGTATISPEFWKRINVFSIFRYAFLARHDYRESNVKRRTESRIRVKRLHKERYLVHCVDGGLIRRRGGIIVIPDRYHNSPSIP